jgi:hypothetical protein
MRAEEAARTFFGPIEKPRGGVREAAVVSILGFVERNPDASTLDEMHPTQSYASGCRKGRNQE